MIKVKAVDIRLYLDFHYKERIINAILMFCKTGYGSLCTNHFNILLLGNLYESKTNNIFNYCNCFNY